MGECSDDGWYLGMDTWCEGEDYPEREEQYLKQALAAGSLRLTGCCRAHDGCGVYLRQL